MSSAQYVDEYTRFLSDTRHRSGNTVEAYRRDIMQFLTYLDKTDGTLITSATRSTVMSYLLSMQKNGRAASSVSRALASIKSFYMYLIRHGDVKLNPADNIELPKAKAHLPNILSEEETARLIGAPSAEDNKGIRDRAMLELLYATGMRVSELINMNITDVNLEMEFVFCRGARTERPIPIGRAASKSLRLYMDEARNKLLRNSDETALFVNINGNRLTRQGFWKIIKHYGKASGIETEITPHTLRHSFAAHLVHNGADLNSIKEMMGHVDIASTQIYSHLPDNKLRSVYDKAHPRANII